ncbi:hypothetical protein ADK90_28190 [Streptomyces sp. XY413]|uniref:hypothetical protein n=1 Tax=Streptomyces sp. XY413 TaxID=1519479 RepID=UPI0006B068DD|nr:hypothetical protein [Streptomyces sp. XY413]KOV16402.1 hypothetical protein ADK90_28190 [Streptomyces sp. XY413]
MRKQARTEWWERLPAGIREEIDGYVLQDAMFAAVRLVVDVGLVRDDVGVAASQLIVGDRYAHYGDRIARTPDNPLDVESLAYRAGGAAGRIVAIEALWDGDTMHDWFVRLLAITADPAEEHALATVYARMARRYLEEGGDCGPRHPVGLAAERAGGALAAHLSVPFHFASPDTPDDEAPRWQPVAPSETGR